jgi:3',5'-cyclic AMP phosphodiesterase CpdA
MNVSSRAFRIAHVSDVHVRSRLGAEWRRMLFNKRITGWANLVLRRGRVHRREYLRAVLEEAAARSDHVVVTGDLTNMAHESEYREARRLLDEVARRVEVTVVPGNHDIYLPAVGRERRFPHHFAPFVTSKRAGLAVTLPAGDHPLVKLRGPAAIVGLSSAVPRPPFVSGGVLGREQIAALERLLALPEVASRTPVLLVHHPPVDARSRFARLRDGLIDADRLRPVVDRLPRGLLLFGHVHARSHVALRTSSGTLNVVSASGAALDHPDPRIRAGFNLYEIAGDGAVARVESYALDPSGKGFSRVPMPARIVS